MRNLDTLYIREMDQEELSEFRRLWIKGYIKELIVECGVNSRDAEEIADIRFEDYIGQEGHTARDERIADSR
ncbi:hypothetical protein LCGC14_2129930 [marine sediment metagenome]|uniref:Uncharacterized protein n=1 Tax=marine sediment metagenome TaxID=412755 RepID=A0A0F9E1R6_9ZZZZ